MQEFNFDKFMDDIEKKALKNKERKEKLQVAEDACGNRDREKLYREKASNRIRYIK